MLLRSRRWALRMGRVFCLSAFCLLLLLSPACSQFQAVREEALVTLGPVSGKDNVAASFSLSSVAFDTEGREASFDSLAMEKEMNPGYDFAGIATEPHHETHSPENPLHASGFRRGRAKKGRMKGFLYRSLPIVLLAIIGTLAVRQSLPKPPAASKPTNRMRHFEPFLAAAERLALIIGTTEARGYANRLWEECLGLVQAEQKVAEAAAAVESAAGAFRLGDRQAKTEELEEALQDAQDYLSTHAANMSRLVGRLIGEAGRQANVARQDLCELEGLEQLAMILGDNSENEGDMLQVTSVSLLSASGLSKLEAHMGNVLSGRIRTLETKQEALQRRLDAVPDLQQTSEIVEKQRQLMVETARYLSPLSLVVKNRTHTFAFAEKMRRFGFDSLKSSFVIQIATSLDALRQARDIFSAYAMPFSPKQTEAENEAEIPYVDEPAADKEETISETAKILAGSENVARGIEQLQQGLMDLSTASTVQEAVNVYDASMKLTDFLWSVATPIIEDVGKLQEDENLINNPEAVEVILNRRKESLRAVVDRTMVQCEYVREAVKTVYTIIGRLNKAQQNPDAHPVVAAPLFQSLVSRAVDLEKDADHVAETAVKTFAEVQEASTFSTLEAAGDKLYHYSRAALQARSVAEELAHSYVTALLLENEVYSTANRRPELPFQVPRTSTEKAANRAEALQARLNWSEKNAMDASTLSGLAFAVAGLRTNSLMLECGSLENLSEGKVTKS